MNLLLMSALTCVLIFGGAGITAAAESIPVLFPNGPVAATQRQLLLEALGVMAIVVIPVFILFGVCIWRYRVGKNPGDYAPDWDFSRNLELAVWLVPAVIVVIIGYLQWTRTHRLDPYASAGPAGAEVLEIQAIALDWKWLFLYPEAGIASLDHLVVPAGQPFEVALTSDTVMNAFFVPGLGGQIYAMAGMRTNMNLLADTPQEMWGRNTQFNGAGFSDQDFAVSVMSPAGYADWLAQAQAGQTVLDAAGYAALRVPSVAPEAQVWAAFPTGLFDTVIGCYGHEMATMNADKTTTAQPETGVLCAAGAK